MFATKEHHCLCKQAVLEEGSLLIIKTSDDCSPKPCSDGNCAGDPNQSDPANSSTSWPTIIVKWYLLLKVTKFGEKSILYH